MHWKYIDSPKVNRMKCLRCRCNFENPVPPVTDPGGFNEIACKEWCPECNTLAMSVIFRESSAYRTKELTDPLRWPKERRTESDAN